MTLSESDLQSDGDLDSFRNFWDVLYEPLTCIITQFWATFCLLQPFLFDMAMCLPGVNKKPFAW